MNGTNEFDFGIDLFSGITIGRKKRRIIDVLFSVPKKYEVFHAIFQPIDFELTYIFDFNPVKRFNVGDKIKIYGMADGIEIVVFHSRKMAFSFYSPVRISGKLSINPKKLVETDGGINEIWCFYPNLAKKMEPGIYGEYEENYSPEVISRVLGLLPKDESFQIFRQLHRPVSLEEANLALARLGAHELEVIFSSLNKKPKVPNVKTPELKIPFVLTDQQKIVLNEIYQDLESSNQCFRLLQGDVGCGKTIVAILAAAKVIENGKKVVVLSPTTVLAYQLQKRFSEILKIPICFTPNNKNFRQEIADVSLIIGTHALFYDVEISNLGLLIIDEQHRFGVIARNKLMENNSADLLMMTATPIPRSYEMILKSALKFSLISEKPNVSSVKTYIFPQSRRDEILKKAIVSSKTKKIFWICRRAQDTEILYELAKDQTNAFRTHGKLSDKHEIIQAFSKGILFGTTVLEVGIDVEDLDVIIVDEADKFGLAQIHQLRGRVGRHRDGVCFLIGENLEKLREIEKSDCFQLSEMDHKKRGYGQILGTVQSGLTSFHFLKTIENNRVINAIDRIYLPEYDKKILFLIREFLLVSEILL